MNVTCPNCATVYRVDPAKVPEAGVRARCAVCTAIFAVRREAEAAAAPPPAPRPVEVPQPVEAARPAEVARPVAAPAAVPVMAAPAIPVSAPPAPAPPPPAPSRPVGPPRPAAPPAFAGNTARPATVQAAAPAAETARLARPATARPVNPFLSQDPSLKARRLARALISDMVVYHPAKRQEGLRDGTLKELFEEEIKKSWDEYMEQVGRDVAESTPYFREALNEILAGGKQIF